MELQTKKISPKFWNSLWSSCKKEISMGHCDALLDLVPFVQFKGRENTHEGG